tara:strand:- start:444 stop:581 length:138 start_codon:yes stop_codon:yes gene_type:complete
MYKNPGAFFEKGFCDVIASAPIAASNQNVFVFKIKVQKFTYTALL